MPRVPLMVVLILLHQAVRLMHRDRVLLLLVKLLTRKAVILLLEALFLMLREIILKLHLKRHTQKVRTLKL
jgi:hypothetical protein